MGGCSAGLNPTPWHPAGSGSTAAGLASPRCPRVQRWQPGGGPPARRASRASMVPVGVGGVTMMEGTCRCSSPGDAAGLPSLLTHVFKPARIRGGGVGHEVRHGAAAPPPTRLRVWLNPLRATREPAATPSGQEWILWGLTDIAAPAPTCHPPGGADGFNLGGFLISRKAPRDTGGSQGGFGSSRAGKCLEGTDTDSLNLFLIKDKALNYVRELEKLGGVLFYCRLQGSGEVGGMSWALPWIWSRVGTPWLPMLGWGVSLEPPKPSRSHSPNTGVRSQHLT